MNNRTTLPAIILPAFLVIVLTVAAGGAGERDTLSTLAERVQALHLGMQGYVLGRPLTASQKAVAAAHPVAGAYTGTYRFRDGGLTVVADRRDDRVLAMYERQEKVGFDRLKAMVARLMTSFAEPTTMAHDKILYWAFSARGPVSEEEFAEAKKEKKTGELGILATVKLKSTMEIVPGPEDPARPMPPEKRGTIYFIITSDPMVQAFMAGQG